MIYACRFVRRRRHFVVVNAGKHFHDVAQSFERINFNTLDKTCFSRVRRRDYKLAMSRLHCGYEQRHNAVDVAKFAVERQFAYDDVLFVRLVFELTCGSHDAECDRKVEHGAFLLCVGRREIDDNTLCRILKTAVFHRRTHALFALLGSRRCKPDHIVTGQTAVDIDLNVNGITRQSVQGVTEYLCEHNTLPYIFISLLILS